MDQYFKVSIQSVSLGSATIESYGRMPNQYVLANIDTNDEYKIRMLNKINVA